MQNEKRKKKSKSNGQWLAIILFMLIGAACGVLILMYLEQVKKDGTGKNEYILSFLLMFVGVMKYTVRITAKADDGYYFVSDLAAYLNNSAASVSVSADGKYATVSREYDAMIWSPQIIKHPGAEAVDEGGFVSFVSTATFALSLTWELPVLTEKP